MPLKKGKTKKTIQQNIDEMLASWRKTGKIGNTKPRNQRHAIQIASAAAHTKAKGKK